MEINNTLA